MKNLLSIVFLFAFSSSFSQETETVIRFDAQRNAQSKKEFIWKQQGETRGGTASLTLPFFDDFSLLQNKDLIRLSDGRQTMRNHDRCPTLY